MKTFDKVDESNYEEVRTEVYNHEGWLKLKKDSVVTKAQMKNLNVVKYMAMELGIYKPKQESEKVNYTQDNSTDVLAATQALVQTLQNNTVNEQKVAEIVKKEVSHIKDLVTEMKPKIVVKDKENKVLGELPKTRHPMTETLLTIMNTRSVDGRTINAWIAGPAGSGKTFAAKQVAEALKLDFGFHGAMTMAHELTGFVDAGGTYHETVFVRLYRNGGICLLDECDAGSSEALLALNAALANGQMSLPNGEIIEQHPDFRCIAAANTFGHGATADYVGRAKIDAAFLDRFGARLSWDYDENLEKQISGNVEWATEVQRARGIARSKGLKVLITPRASISGAAMLAAGMDITEVRMATYLSGVSDGQRNLFQNIWHKPKRKENF